MAELSWLRDGSLAAHTLSTSDWTANALGDPAGWSPALRAALAITLQSSTPMLLVWGSARNMLYNDTLAARLGSAHPAVFGAPLGSAPLWGDDASGMEALLRSTIDAVFASGQQQRTVMSAASTGQVSEEFSCMPIPQDDAGVPAGVLCTWQGVASNGEAGQVCQQGLLHALMGPSPGFKAVVRGAQHVFDSVNEACARLLGQRALVGLPAREALPELLDGQLFKLLDQVRESGQAHLVHGLRLFLRHADDTPYAGVVLEVALQPITDGGGQVEGILIEGHDITERVVAEERLRIVDRAGGIGIFEWFPQTDKLSVSDRFRRLWGLAPSGEVSSAELVAMIDEQFHPNLGTATIKEPARKNPLEYTEYQITRPDGQQRWLARKGEMVQDDPRSGPRYAGVVFDVTARKLMEQALAASEASVRANNAFVRQLLDSTDQGFFSIDRDGTITLCNAAFLRMLGYASEKEVLGRGLHEVILVPAETAAAGRSECAVLKAAREGVSAQADNENFLRVDGSSFPVQYQTHPVWQDGRLQGALCTFIDLTERRRGMQALSWSENRLTAIFNQASVCFSELDLHGRYLRVNKALCRMLGRSEEALLQMTLADVTHPDDVPMNMSLFNRSIVDGRSFTLEKRYLRPDGSTFWVSSDISRIVDAEGRPQAMIAVSTDITERRRAEEALRELNDTLEQRVVEEIVERSRAEAALRQMQKMEAVGQLTGGVAHDFNNVLQIIGGNLQLLQSDPQLDERGRQRIRIATGAVDRGAKLSSQLLAFARRQPLQPRSINLERVVQNMEDLLRRAVGEHIEISTMVTRELWNTMLDPNQVENLIINTAINARDAMPTGGRLTVQIDNVQLSDPGFLSQADLAAGDYVELQISDNGAGMSPEVRERAFEPFFTTKREGEGTGLGLSMAYGFVKQSKGHISLHSEPGKGTTIRIYFPRCIDEEVLIEDQRDMEVRGGDETILVVEDDANLQLTVIDTLSSLGYRVLKADNGERALAILQSGMPIDLMFTDVVMPGSVAVTELARQARQLLPDMEILFTSGYPRDAIVHEGRLDAGVELLSKPYRVNQLARRIRHLLSNRAHRSGLAQAVREQESATIHKLPVAERQRQADVLPAELERQAYGTTDGSGGGANLAGASGPSGEGEASGLRMLVVEDNIDSQQLVCELLETLGHRAHGVASGEDAEQALEKQEFDVLFTDVNLPGMSGVELAKGVLARFPEMSVIFASGYGAMVARNVGFPSYSLPKPYDIDQLQEILTKIAMA